MSKKLTKPEIEKEEKRIMVLENVQDGLESILSHLLVSESIRLGKLVRMAYSDAKRADPSLYEPVFGQLLRGLNSIGSNFVEGYAKCTYEAKLNFWLISRGSAYECIVHARTLDLDIEKGLRVLCDLVDTELKALLASGELNAAQYLDIVSGI